MLSWVHQSPQTASRSVQSFLHSSRQSRRACRGTLFPLKIAHSNGDLYSSSRQKVPILYNGRPFPQKLPLPIVDLDPMIPLAHPSPQPTQHLDCFSHFCKDDRTVWQWATPLKIAPFCRGSGSHLIHGFLGPPKSSTQMASRSVQLLLQGSLV